MKTMKYFTTKGYSNGDTFLSTDEILNMSVRTSPNSDTIKYKGDTYLFCSKIEHILEKYFPDISIPEFRGYSAKSISSLLDELTRQEEAAEALVS